MINVANITDIGINATLDTSSNGIMVIPPANGVSMPSSDPQFFDQCATADPSKVKGANSTLIAKGNFVGDFIESIAGVASTFFKFMGTFSSAIFSIHTLCAPIFGNFNAWVLEGMVDIVFGIALFQMVTGRSFKTME
jgi:hypothetical protein